MKEQSDLPNQSFSRNLQLGTLFAYMTAAYKLKRALDRVTVKRGVFNGEQANSGQANRERVIAADMLMGTG